MSKFLRIIVSAVVGLAGALVFAPGVALASLSVDVGFGFSATGYTVGDTDIPVTLTIANSNTTPQDGDINTVCNSDSSSPPCLTPGVGTPADDKGINFVMSCGSLDGIPVTCGTADSGVFTADATGTGAVGTACAGQLFDIIESDATFGTLRFTPQGPDPLELAGGATCTIEFEVDVVGYPAVDQDPGTAGRQTAQIADVLVYSAALDAYDSDSSNLTIAQAAPTIATQASATAGLGSTISDTAFVSGRAFPASTANVHFDLYGPDDVTCSGTPVFSSDTAISDTQSNVTSATFSPTSIGTYRWVARYDGDANNQAVTGQCNDANESVIVTQAAPMIETTASADTRLGAGVLTDTATVSGRIGAVAGSNVTFNLFGPDDATCASGSVFESVVGLPIESDVVTSAPFTPTVPGTYRWIASYDGDANNLAAAGECNDDGESVGVDKAQPSITTDAGDDVGTTGSIADKATITGLVSPSGSTVDFRLYGPDDATCVNDPAFEALGVALPAADTMVMSPSFTPGIAGTYQWVAIYNGDANNESIAGECGDLEEIVRVLQSTPTITTQASPGVAVGTGTLTDVATVTGRVLPQPGATIDFRLYGPGDTTCTAAPVFESLGVSYSISGGAVRSAPYTPMVIGTYRWVATYRGDANNSTVSGECGDPAEMASVTIDPDIELPATGAESATLLRTGGGIFLIGLALIGLTGRRRRALLNS